MASFLFDACGEGGRPRDMRKLYKLLAETKDAATAQPRVLVIDTPEIPVHLRLRANLQECA